MRRPAHQRECEHGWTRWGGESQDDEAPEEELDLDNLDPEGVVWIGDGKLIHGETGIIIEEKRIDPGPGWWAFSHPE